MTETVFTTPGTHSWTAPAGVIAVSAVCVGGGGTGDDGNSGDGGGGGGGGGLAFANAVPVTPGVSYTVVVGAGGSAGNGKNARAQSGGNSTFSVGSFVITANGGQGGIPYGTIPGSTGGTFGFANTPGSVTTGGGDGGKGGAGYNGGGGGGGAGGRTGRGGHGSDSITGYGNNSTEQAGVGTDSGGGGGAARAAGAGVSGGGNGGVGQSDRTGGGGGGADVRAAVAPTNGGNGNGLSSAGSQGGAGGFPGGGGGGSWDNGTGVASAGGDGIVVLTFVVVVLPDGLTVSSNTVVSGETLTVTLTSQGTADGTAIPYTISGVNSADINGVSLTGNFNIVNNSGTLNLSITTTSRKTFSITSNGFTQTASLVENRFGLVILSESALITTTSRDLTVVDLSSVNFLTSITLLSNTDRFAVNTESLLFYTSADRNEVINLTVGIDSLYNITILQPNESAKFNFAASPSVLLALRSFITIDFASRTSFNAADALDFDPPQYWIGA